MSYHSIHKPLLTPVPNLRYAAVKVAVGQVWRVEVAGWSTRPRDCRVWAITPATDRWPAWANLDGGVGFALDADGCRETGRQDQGDLLIFTYLPIGSAP